MRIALLYSNEELIGKTRAFDGMVLFLPFKLQDQVYLKEKILGPFIGLEKQHIWA